LPQIAIFAKIRTQNICFTRQKTISPSFMFSLKNKTAVITGGASGIGKAIAELFGQQGAHAAIIDLDPAAGEAVAAHIRAAGGQASAWACNVAHQAEVVAAFAQIAQQTGGVDILVNNAGIAHVGRLDNTTEADFDRIFEVNVKGVYNCMYAAIPYLEQQPGAAIVNLASIAAMVGIPDRFAYSMSKGAIVAMSLSVARDYLGRVRCNTISPARVHTPFVDGFIAKNYPGQEAEIFAKLSASQPIGRMGQPAEVAALALYLCSDEAAFITGNNYPIDGGFVTIK
jgi:NAD(P)-dependent dehydrogenase (short-subunit alcohol dehydrogenase family)